MLSSLIVMQKMLDTYITTLTFRFPAIDGFGYTSQSFLFWPPTLISLLFSKFFSNAYSGEMCSDRLVSAVYSTIRSWSGVKHLCVAGSAPIVTPAMGGFPPVGRTLLCLQSATSYCSCSMGPRERQEVR